LRIRALTSEANVTLAVTRLNVFIALSSPYILFYLFLTCAADKLKSTEHFKGNENIIVIDK